MAVQKLTSKRVSDAQPDPGKAETVLWDSEAKGLCLRIRESGAKTWRVVFRLNDGRQVKLTLGDAASIPLDDARKLARAEIVKAAGGADPRNERKAAKLATARVVSAVIDSYENDMKARNCAPNHVSNTISTLRRCMSTASGRDIATLTRQECVDLINKVPTAGARTAFRTRLTPLLNFATNQGLAPANVLAGWRQPRRSRAEATDKPGRALTAAEIRAVWNAASGTFGDAVKVLMLTGLRRSEALSLERGWVDDEKNAIIIPGHRMKSGKSHAVPLTPALKEILDNRPVWAVSDLFFPARSRRGDNKGEAVMVQGTSKLLPKLLKASGTADWSLHDLRRTYRSMLSDLGFDEDLAERMIAHTRDSLLERYDRSTRWPERVAAAEAVERHVLKIVAGQDGGNVVSLSSRPA
jgi:integrase